MKLELYNHRIIQLQLQLQLLRLMILEAKLCIHIRRAGGGGVSWPKKKVKLQLQNGCCDQLTWQHDYPQATQVGQLQNCKTGNTLLHPQLASAQG